jgi:hypothetical protein
VLLSPGHHDKIGGWRHDLLLAANGRGMSKISFVNITLPIPPKRAAVAENVGRGVALGCATTVGMLLTSAK